MSICEDLVPIRGCYKISHSMENTVVLSHKLQSDQLGRSPKLDFGFSKLILYLNQSPIDMEVDLDDNIDYSRLFLNSW